MNKDYYKKMLEKDRLKTFYHNGKLLAILTYFIGNNEDKYIRSDSWSVLDDEPKEGRICFVDQFISNKNLITKKLLLKMWRSFKKNIKEEYPQIEQVRWNRFRDKK